MEELQEEQCTHKLVAITWLDADCSAGWQEVEKDSSPEHLVSYGLLADEDENFITLTFTHNRSGDDYLALHRVPKSMIHEVRVIKSDAPCSVCHEEHDAN